MMIEKIRVVLGETMGDVEEVEAEGNQLAWGRYLRVRVALNVRKLLKRGRKISIAGGESIFAIFKYERFPDFCYICGCLDHQELDCDELVRMRSEGIKIQREYGPWIRAESSDLLSRKNDGQKELSKDFIGSGKKKCLLLFIEINQEA